MKVSIKKPQQPLSGHINPQSSKNYTTRCILASCLADGQSTVWYPAVQDDAVALVRCCQKLGAEILTLDKDGSEISFDLEHRKSVERLVISGFGSNPRTPADGILDPDNAGAVLRMLIGITCLCDGPVTFQTEKYPHSLGKRPNVDLTDALIQYGIEVKSPNEEATLPLTFSGGKKLTVSQSTENYEIEISGAVSSQYLSSLLFMAPILPRGSNIKVTNGLKSKPLIKTTLDVLRDARLDVEAADDLESFSIKGNQKYQPREWFVNGDWPGVSAVLAAAAVVPNSNIVLSRMKRDQQGEQKCLEFYRDMGCDIKWAEGEKGELQFRSPNQLKAAKIDGDQATDGVLAMMSVAACADGTSEFSGINNLQFKECDRVREPIAEMKKIFTTNSNDEASASWTPESEPEIITVNGSPNGFVGGVEVDGRGDHRVIMLLSILALRSEKPITITGAEHVAKSYPGWFETLEQMGVKVEIAE